MPIIRPLAYQLRPTTLTEVVGQTNLIQPGGPIYQMVKTQHCQSFILYGPAGTGKTSIASALAHDLNLPFNLFNAATGTKKQLQTIVHHAETDQQTQIIFVDEIHRLTKTLQDFLLPYTENGELLLIGATTENPYIALSPAIRSRCQLFAVHAITPTEMKQALQQAITRQPTQQLLTHQFNTTKLNLTQLDPLLTKLADHTHGDVRTALNALEYILSNGHYQNGQINFTPQLLTQALPQQIFNFDQSGDENYNTISAFQKSIRGSDVDAALIYLARLIKSGDLPIIIRRLSVIAFEDIGVADPTTVNFVTNAIQVAQQSGFPEARIPLSDAVIKLCLAPKSNLGEKSIDLATDVVDHDNQQTIPNHLKDTHFKHADQLGHTGYKYPHDYPYQIIKQQYLPDNLTQQTIFKPKANEAGEGPLAQQWNQIKKLLR